MSGHANSSSPRLVIRSSFGMPFQATHSVRLDTTPIGPVATKAISPAREAMSHQLVPLGSPSKYQAPKTGEAALPQEPFRRNMYVERWRQPIGFNVHIAHSNGSNGGIGRGRRNHARVPEKIRTQMMKMR